MRKNSKSSKKKPLTIHQQVAAICGCDVSLVSHVVNGNRENDFVLKTYKALIEAQEGTAKMVASVMTQQKIKHYGKSKF